MAPEHAAGQQVDARADVYSAGVVLAEMVSPDGIKSYESRQSVWEGVRSEPAQLPDSPWAPVIQRAVARDRERRPNSAHTLIRELEDVTLRVEGAEDLHPYPGLASFTEDDAEYFFGREAEVEAMWRKLDGSPRMLGLVGPSGAGKSSFLRAGLIPAAPSGWTTVLVTPGGDPRASLRRAVISMLEGDHDALRELAEGSDDASVSAIARWRQHHEDAVVIVDQFEELFTQNGPEDQHRFAELLGRLVLEADVFVVLSMRDDFLIHCNRHESLRPLFSELTPLDPPTGAALRRALVQPATKCGYRFEDDDLVEEILTEVEGERGALPLLAFALARLWEKRDRETGLLTRQAYNDIGGVGGALARHAEATVDRIGVERIPIVRELFRNLVTAEGTRAVREWDELLSVFERSALPAVASKGLRVRSAASHSERSERSLLTANEVSTHPLQRPRRRCRRGPCGAHRRPPAHLLRGPRGRARTHPPRRDHPRVPPRQLAPSRALADPGSGRRPAPRRAPAGREDLGRTRPSRRPLWTGTAYREFRLWSERYPGGLTESEEAFAAAMITFAGRRKRDDESRRPRRSDLSCRFAIVFAGLWHREHCETRRAEAAELLSFRQVRLDDFPTAALTNATASLELADSEEARSLAIRALWEGPTAFVVNEIPSTNTYFSPDGMWAVQAHDSSSSISVISRSGDQQVFDTPSESGTTRTGLQFSSTTSTFLSIGNAGDLGTFALWSAPEGRMLATATPVEDAEVLWGWIVAPHNGRTRGLILLGKGNLVTLDALNEDGSHVRLGEYRLSTSVEGTPGCLAGNGEWFAIRNGDEILAFDITSGGISEPHLLGRDDDEYTFWNPWLADLEGRFFLTIAKSGRLRKWDPSGSTPPEEYRVPVGATSVHDYCDGGFLSTARPLDPRPHGINVWRFDESGLNLLRSYDKLDFEYHGFDWVRLRLAIRGPLPFHRLWELGKPAAARPLSLRNGPSNYSHRPWFSPDGTWLVTNGVSGTHMWPLGREYPAIIDIDFKPWSRGLVFGPEGRFVATSADSEVRVWPLGGDAPPEDYPAFEDLVTPTALDVSPDGQFFAAGSGGSPGRVWIGRAGEDPTELQSANGLKDGSGVAVTFSQDGRYILVIDGGYDIANGAVHVWEVATKEEVAVLRPENGQLRRGLEFTSDGSLLVATTSGVLSWDIETNKRELLIDVLVMNAISDGAGRRLVLLRGENEDSFDPTGSPIFVDLDTGEITDLLTHGSRVRAIALARDGSIVVTGDADGVVRVGHVSGEEPHLLIGHEKQIFDLAIDPLGRWIASTSRTAPCASGPCPISPNRRSTPCLGRSSSPSSRRSPISAWSATPSPQPAGSSLTIPSRGGRRCRRGEHRE